MPYLPTTMQVSRALALTNFGDWEEERKERLTAWQISRTFTWFTSARVTVNMLCDIERCIHLLFINNLSLSEKYLIIINN